MPESLAKPKNHSQCAGRVRTIEASHLSNPRGVLAAVDAPRQNTNP
ncbi:hypothetical protein AB0I77_18810 [Streptomyces sp. NPDC050619]